MLPFDAEVLASLYEQANRAIWPGQLLVLALGLGVIVFACRPVAGSKRAIGWVLAAGWAWTGAVFHLTYFAPLNFAAPIYGWLFIIEAVLVAWTMGVRGYDKSGRDIGAFGWVGLGLALVALIVAPLAEGLVGAGWAAVQLPGLAPDPTAVFTLAVLLILRGRAPLHLALLPALWLAVAAATAWMLEAPGAMVLPVLGIAGALLLPWKNRVAG